MVVALRYLLIVGLIGFVVLGVGPAVWDAIVQTDASGGPIVTYCRCGSLMRWYQTECNNCEIARVVSARPAPAAAAEENGRSLAAD